MMGLSMDVRDVCVAYIKDVMPSWIGCVVMDAAVNRRFLPDFHTDSLIPLVMTIGHGIFG